MTASTPSFLGKINNAGDDNALFLKVFSSEVLAAFAKSNKMLAMTMVRSISSGKSAQFPVFGRAAAAEYHTPGGEILGQILQGNEKIITIDDLLISHSFISELDQAKVHFDYRNVYSKEMGEALANKVDQHLLQLVCLAARAAETTSGTGAGNEIVDADAATNADSLVASIFEAAEDLDNNNVPESDRFCVVSPNIYYNIVQSDKILNRDFGGANGVYADGTVLKVAGVNIVKSNTCATAFANNSSNSTAGTNNTYNVAAQATVAVVFHKSAVGTVKLKDLKMESDYDIRRQGTLLLGKLAYGHGILRPESAVEITTS